MAVRFLGSALTGSVTMQLGAATPVTVADWGGSGGGGTIAINVFQSDTRLNPESVGFTVDLDSSNFDTAGPGAGEYYDARMHDLVYFWDYDDAAHPMWSAPENILPEWNNRNRGIGPSVQHVYLDPRPASLGAGNGYNPGVLVIEPSSGKWATASVEVFVEDREVIYSTVKTICVNPSSDTDWTWANSQYPNADQVYIDTFNSSDPSVSGTQFTGPIRWLFKRGAEFNMNFQITGAYDAPLYFGAYGDPAEPLPVINSVSLGNGNDKSPIRWRPVYDLETEPVGELRIVDLDFKGNWDATSMTLSSPNADKTIRAVSCATPVDLVMHNCRMRNFFNPCDVSSGSAEDERYRLHFDDVDVVDFGGQYPFLISPMRHDESSIGFTGCKITQVAGGAGYNQGSNRLTGSGSLIRLEFVKKTYLACLDLYSTDARFHLVKTNNTGEADGIVVNAHGISGEGGAGIITQGTNSTASAISGQQRSHETNGIYDGMIYVGIENTMNPLQTLDSGVTFRNVLYVAPAIDFWVNGHIAFLNTVAFETDTLPAQVRAAPIAAYNCTMVIDQTQVQFADTDPVWHRADEVSYNDGVFGSVTLANNVLSAPNITNDVTAHDPLTTAKLWDTRHLGYRGVTSTVIGGTLPNEVAPDETFFVAYGNMHINGYGGSAQQSYFSGTRGDAVLQFGSNSNNWYSEDANSPVGHPGDIEISYDATGTTVINRSANTWANGTSYTLDRDMGTTAPLLTAWSPPAGSAKDSKPDTGSAALNGATTGSRAFLDLTGYSRYGTGVYDEGTIDRGPWQVS